MKKSSLLWMLIGSSLIALPEITIAAPPTSNNVTVTCPATSPQQNSTNFITNFGSYIAGYGTGSINYGSQYQAYFISTKAIDDIPADLSSYTFLTTNYDSTSGTVTCSYQGTVFNSPVFAISYNITNALGGTVVSQGNNYISINLPFGLVS